MLKVTDILRFVKIVNEKENRPASKKEIVARFANCYIHNASKHIGDVLTRAVKNKKLVRVERGLYKIGEGRNNHKTEIIPENQLELDL